jgi:hypothetical protein
VAPRTLVSRLRSWGGYERGEGYSGRRTVSALKKSIGPLPLIAMGAAGIIATSWIYTNGEFFAA